jgi:hypothetical protein
MPQSAAPQHRSSAKEQASLEQQSGGVVAPRDVPFIILNPPRSNTKGRKKSRIPVAAKKSEFVWCVWTSWS